MEKKKTTKERGTKKYTLEELISTFNEIHNNKYDYSNITEYHNNKQIIYPICPEHGVFKIKVCKHLQGQKCKFCAGNNIMTTEEFIRKAREIHGDKYDYSKSVCNGRHKKIIITCPKHGDFQIKPHDHIGGKQGCRKCANETTSERCRAEEKDIIDRIKKKCILNGYLMKNSDMKECIKR